MKGKEKQRDQEPGLEIIQFAELQFRGTEHLTRVWERRTAPS